MSLNRFNPRRDDNEPLIRARFATHGWHTEQVSGAGMPDLLCWSARRLDVLLVDVKMPGKKATKAQVEKWTALSGKGIPVYVASTEADVDAIVGGTATPWQPRTTERDVIDALHKAVRPTAKRRPVPPAVVGKKVPGIHHCLAKRCFVPMDGTSLYCVKHGYTPPRSTPVDAPALAAETFASPYLDGPKAYTESSRSLAPPVPRKEDVVEPPCSCTREQPCAACSVVPV